MLRIKIGKPINKNIPILFPIDSKEAIFTLKIPNNTNVKNVFLRINNALIKPIVKAERLTAPKNNFI